MERKHGAGSFKKCVQKQDTLTASSQIKIKMRKAFHLIAVAYYVISACCGLGNETDNNLHFESCPEIFSALCVIAEFFREAAKNDTDIDDDQSNKDNLILFEASKMALGAFQCSIYFRVGLAWFQLLAQSVCVS